MSTFLSGLSASPMGTALFVCGLALLVVLVWNLLKRAKTEQTAGDGEKASVPAPVPVLDAQGVSPEVVAAITAALMAVFEGETGFVVRRIKRVSNAPAWNRAGRDEQIYSRL